MDAVIDAAEGPLWLAVNCENTKARGFYTAHKFSKIGEIGFKIGDQSYPNEILRSP